MTIQGETRISVLIVDDHPSTRAGLRAIFEKTPDICVIGEAENSEQAKKALEKFQPKIILLDLKMPDFSPSAFERWVRENYPETITLVLTAHDRDAYLADLLDAGIAGFFDKGISTKQLIEIVRKAASGEQLITSNQVTRAWNWKKEVADKWNNLTERERDVLILLEQGLSNKAIGKQLGITLKTVAYHVSAVFNKLEVTSRHEAVAWHQKHFPKDLE